VFTVKKKTPTVLITEKKLCIVHCSLFILKMQQYGNADQSAFNADHSQYHHINPQAHVDLLPSTPTTI